MQKPSVAFFVSILLTSLLSNCGSTATTNSNQIAPQEIYQWYHVTYSDETGITEAFATLRIGGDTGTTVNLVAPSSLVFDKAELAKSAILGTSYSSKNLANFRPDHRWVWTDNGGKTYTNSVVIAPVVFVNPPTVISKSTPLRIEFSGEAFGESDSIEVLITSASGNNSTIVKSLRSPRFGAGTKSAGIEVPVEDLAKLFEGPASIYLNRSRITSVQEGTKMGGRILSEYQTKRYRLNVTR